MSTPALFLERDGALALPSRPLRWPEELQIYRGIGFGLRRIQAASWCVVVVIGQPAAARGGLADEDLHLMYGYLTAQLGAIGVHLDGVYASPRRAERPAQPYRQACSRPGPAVDPLLQASAELDIDLASSWLIGATLDDVEAGNRAGCRTVLVDRGSEGLPEGPLRTPTAVARSTRHALAITAMLSGMDAIAELSYRPLAWEVPGPELREHSLGELAPPE